MKSRLWIAGFTLLTLVPLSIVAIWTIKVDPYFHYHKPNTSAYFYPLYNQRSQNDGISRNFEYAGLITGTSMTENFKTSEANAVFFPDGDGTFVKVPYSGGTYCEINKNLQIALNHNSNLRIIIRGLDMDKFIEDKNAMREDLGQYPQYLYNDNPFDDVQYLFNREIVFYTIYGMVTENDKPGFEAGITSFDEYSDWMADHTFGVKSVFPNGTVPTDSTVQQVALTEREIQMIIENTTQNITSLAEKYPSVTFYYFFTPYSAAWWQAHINAGTFQRQIQAEKIVIEEILKTRNIKLYSFNNMTNITTDLNNYKDPSHYAEWVNSLILKYMRNGKGLLTEGNYEDYLSTEEAFYWTFDYQQCFDNQEDYIWDYYAKGNLEKSTVLAD